MTLLTTESHFHPQTASERESSTDVPFFILSFNRIEELISPDLVQSRAEDNVVVVELTHIQKHYF